VIDGRNGHDPTGLAANSCQPRGGQHRRSGSRGPTGRRSRPATVTRKSFVGAGSVEHLGPGQGGRSSAFNANGSGAFSDDADDDASPARNGCAGNARPSADVNGDGFGRRSCFGSFRSTASNALSIGSVACCPVSRSTALDTIWDSPRALRRGAHRPDGPIFLGGDASPGGPCGSQNLVGGSCARSE